MRKAIALLLAALLVLALCACGEKEPTVIIETAAPRATEALTTPKPTAALKPTATPKPTAAPTAAPTETPALQTLEPAQAEDPAPDRSAPAADPTPTPAQERDYVLNTNTMKFHVTSCSSVKDIKDSNRKDVHATRDSIIAQGYSPCGRCKP